MKTKSIIMTAIIAVLLSSIFVSCSKDDESDNPLVGKWVGEYKPSVGTSIWVYTYIFRSDGTGISDSYDTHLLDTDPEEFNYTYTDDTIIIDFGDGDPERYTYHIDGNTMWLSKKGGITFIKQ